MLLVVIIGCLFLDSEPLAAGNKGTKHSESSGLWALNKLRKPKKPKVKETNWPRVPIDYFILEKLSRPDWLPHGRLTGEPSRAVPTWTCMASHRQPQS